MEISKVGMFSIIGRPNVGKSTLTNALVGEKVAIVSPKPQTTRNRIVAVVNREDTQFIFMDTPGFHKPRTKLGEFMTGVVYETMADTDAALLVVEPSMPGKPEKLLVEELVNTKVPIIVVINKVDTVPKAEILGVIAAYSELCDPAAIIPISARTGDGVDIIWSELGRFSTDSPALYPEDMTSDQPENVMLAEFIREKLLKFLDREVPHGIGVEIEKFEDLPGGAVEVGAVIYCEKPSHKGIIIGRDGAMLKRVGETAREDMEKFLGARVFLTLWVKVKEGWRDNERFMRTFGYERE